VQVEDALKGGRSQLAQLEQEHRSDSQLVLQFREGGMQLQQAIEESKQARNQESVSLREQDMHRLRQQAAELAQRLRARKSHMEQLGARDAELVSAGQRMQGELQRVSQDIHGLNLVSQGRTPEQAMEILKRELQ